MGCRAVRSDLVVKGTQHLTNCTLRIEIANGDLDLAKRALPNPGDRRSSRMRSQRSLTLRRGQPITEISTIGDVFCSPKRTPTLAEIGRASCRDREYSAHVC